MKVTPVPRDVISYAVHPRWDRKKKGKKKRKEKEKKSKEKVEGK